MAALLSKVVSVGLQFPVVRGRLLDAGNLPPSYLPLLSFPRVTILLPPYSLLVISGASARE